MSDLVVGVDIGGTKTAILVTDAGAEPADERADGSADRPAEQPREIVRARVVAPTATGAPDRAADTIAAMVVAALGEAGATASEVAALGVGVPGRVDPERGHVTGAVNLDWLDLPLGARLESSLGIPTVLENDVRAAALGLHRRRVFGSTESLALLAVGTGIAAGVVLDGRLHRGAHGLAGEIGHVIIESDGPRCACGNRGCVEAVAAGPAIVARTKAGWAARRDGRPPQPSEENVLDAGDAGEETLVDAEGVFAAEASGDAVAAEVIDAAGRAIAWSIHLLALAYDVERIVIGGGVSHAGEPFMAPIRRQLDRYRSTSVLAAEILLPETVQLLPPDSDAGAWGAVTIAREFLAGRTTATAAR